MAKNNLRAELEKAESKVKAIKDKMQIEENKGFEKMLKTMKKEFSESQKELIISNPEIFVFSINELLTKNANQFETIFSENLKNAKSKKSKKSKNAKIENQQNDKNPKSENFENAKNANFEKNQNNVFSQNANFENPQNPQNANFEKTPNNVFQQNAKSDFVGFKQNDEK